MLPGECRWSVVGTSLGFRGVRTSHSKYMESHLENSISRDIWGYVHGSMVRAIGILFPKAIQCSYMAAPLSATEET